jgi:hypothetical protein
MKRVRRALALTVAAPGPASAADTQCNVGYFCVWKDPNYGGSYAGTVVAVPFWNDDTTWGWNALDGADDAFWNRSVYNQTIYGWSNYTEPIVCAAPSFKIGSYGRYANKGNGSKPTGGATICSPNWRLY